MTNGHDTRSPCHSCFRHAYPFRCADQGSRDGGPACPVPPGPGSPVTVRQILAKTLNADCPRCGSDPLEPCWPDDWHLERVIRAWIYRFISSEEMQAVLEALIGFQLETAFRHVPVGRAA